MIAISTRTYNTRASASTHKQTAHTPAVQGRSMIEMLGVLAIIGVLSAGGIMGYTTAMENYRFNQTAEDIKTSSTNTIATFQGSKHEQQAYMKVDVSRLCQIGVVTDPYCKLKSRWNTLASFSLYTGNNCGGWGTIKGSEPCIHTEFAVYDIPKSACVKFLTHDWSNFAPAYRISVVEHSTPTNWQPYVFKASVRQNQRPLSVAEAETACTKTTYDYIKAEGRFYLKGTPLP